MARGPQGIEQDGIKAPKYSRGTEDHCFKGEVQHKTYTIIIHATKANLIKPPFLELVQLQFFING